MQETGNTILKSIPENEDECPVCEREFKSRKGMLYHHGRKHDGNVRIEVACANCGDTLHKAIHEVEGRENLFCGRECSAEWKNGREAPPDHNFRKQGKAEYECDECGRFFHRYPSKVAGENTFCGRECARKFKTGEREYGIHYGLNWREQREKRLERDDYQCVICGKSNGEEKEMLGQELQVHHIQKARKFEVRDGQIDYERANRLENLLTLCCKCHHRWEGIPLRPEVVE